MSKLGNLENNIKLCETREEWVKFFEQLNTSINLNLTTNELQKKKLQKKGWSVLQKDEDLPCK